MIRDKSVEDVYDFEKILGEGGYATVVLGRHLQTGQRYAIKIVDKRRAEQKQDQEGSRIIERVRTEVEIMYNCSHKHLMRLVESYESPIDISIVMPLMEGGELWDRIFEKGHFAEIEAVRLVRQIVSAVDYLHDHSIIHRDLKPENMLCTAKGDDFDIVISDFGLAKKLAPGMEITTPCGTSGYVAPEKIPAVLEDGSVVLNPYGKAADMFSIGVISYFLLVGKPPFYARTDLATNELVLRGKWTFPPEIASQLSDAAKDFVARLLEANPAKRFNCKQALRHPWLCEPVVRSPSPSPRAVTPSAASPHEIRLLKNSLNAAIDSQRTIQQPLVAPEQSPLWKRRQEKKAQMQQQQQTTATTTNPPAMIVDMSAIGSNQTTPSGQTTPHSLASASGSSSSLPPTSAPISSSAASGTAGRSLSNASAASSTSLSASAGPIFAKPSAAATPHAIPIAAPKPMHAAATPPQPLHLADSLLLPDQQHPYDDKI